MISTTLFPYQNHPYRLEFDDSGSKTICFFSCEEHLKKYLIRYKLDKSKIKIDYNDKEPIQFSSTDQNDIQQGTGKTNRGSTSKGGKCTKNLDKRRNVSKTNKSKR
jgi:hypothetical protein